MKKLKKILRAKRAFSPVIAALILMLLAVAAGVVVYSYVMGWLGGATQTPGGIKGELQFDSIYAQDSTEDFFIYVRNVGQKDLLISKIYVNGIAYDNATTFSTSSLAMADVAYLHLNSTSLAVTSGVFYEVKVTSTDGTVAAQSTEGK